MSSLYGELTGSAKTVATRRGHPNSGLSANIRGLTKGVYTSITAVCSDEMRTRPNPGDKHKYRMIVQTTGGSNNPMVLHEIYRVEWEE